MESSTPGVTTSYTVSLTYVTPEPVGSLDLLFCQSPIPYDPCVVPEGLDVSGAVLTGQTGEGGFSIGAINGKNHIILKRDPSMISSATAESSYKFNNIVNPKNEDQAFSIRLRSHTTTDASGSQIDFGSVRGQMTRGIALETQVPPMLIFCVAQEVSEDCSETNETYYSDMGTLSHDSTLTAQSQMAAGTNATRGFVITANGETLSAGTNVIDALGSPSSSTPGVNQFGINLTRNDELQIGELPEGSWTNAFASPKYAQPNKYLFVSGDPVAYSTNVSLMKKFTVSYIVNSSQSLRAGVYTTTINYIASGRF